MELANIFKNTPAPSFKLRDCGNGLSQLIAPIFHDDGDMMNIYLSVNQENKIDISDAGMTLMRLSYTFDIDTDRKRKILDALISAKNAENRNGDIVLTTSPDHIYDAIMTYSQLIAEICNLDMLSRENVADMFYEDLENILSDNFHLSYDKDVYAPGYTDMKIDYKISCTNRPPLYLFGVKTTDKANQTTICCLNLIQKHIPHKSVIIFENMDILTKFSRNSLMNVAGKIFTDLDGFKENGQQFFEQELSA